MPIEDQKAQERPDQGGGQEADAELILAQAVQKEQRRRDQVHAACQPIHAVQKIDRVHHQQQPEQAEDDGQGEGQRTDRLAGERIVEALDEDQAGDGDARRCNLPDQLPVRGEIELIVQQPDEEDQRAARQQAEQPNRLVGVGALDGQALRDEDGGHKGEPQRQGAQLRDGALMPAAAIRLGEDAQPMR